MPLPDKVIEQLGREPPKTPGWAFGVVMFSGAMLFVVVFVYVGLVFGYEPYISSELQKTQDQVSQLGQSISPTDQANLLKFYSQISNLRTLLRSHTLSGQLFAWLEKNTEANVQYSSLQFSSKNQVQLVGKAKAESDVNQQVAIFEASPQVQRVSVTSVSAAQEGSGVEFALTIYIDPAMLSNLLSATPAASASTTSATTTTQ